MKQNRWSHLLLPVTFAMAAVIALPAIAHAQTVRVNWSKKAPFTDIKTYQFIPSQNPDHPFYRQYVDQYVNQDLQKKGLRQVSASQNPDVLVTYHFLTQQTTEQETNGFSDGGWGGFGGWGGWGMGDGMGGMYDSTTTNVPVTMGLLTVDMIDAKTKKIIWRGQATEDTVTKNNKGEEKSVAKSLHKMLDHFPPK